MASDSPFDTIYRSSDDLYYGGKPSWHLLQGLQAFELKPGRALEVGCGEGRNALYLASIGYDVQAFDLSPPAIEKLKARAEQHELMVRATVSEIRSYPYGTGVFDLLVAGTVLGHVARDEAAALVARWQESLAPGGCLYVSTFTTDDPACRGESASETVGFVESFYDAAEFRGFFDGLTPLQTGVEEFLDTSHGPAHYHSVVRFFGRKPD